MSSTIPNMDDSSGLKELIRARIVKRYLNMRCNEFVKVVKFPLNRQKEKKHRKKVKEKASKGHNNTRNLVSQLCNDISEGKNVSFYTLKAMAATGKESFMQLNKKEIHFLFHLFGLTFKKSMNKTKLCEVLATGVNHAHAMTNPSLCTKDELISSVQENKKCTTCSSTRGVPETIPNQDNTHPSAIKQC